MPGLATRSILAMCLVAACSAGGRTEPPPSGVPALVTPLPMPATTPTSAAASPVVPAASAAPTTEPAPRSTTGSRLPDVQVGAVAVTVADEGVRMRSLPEISDASIRYEPKLPLGTELFVLGGPVAGDGYDWYQVAPIGADMTARWGWVADASREGEPWLTPGRASCPSMPADVAALDASDFGTRLACFGGVPITLSARILDCNCSIDPGESIEPRSYAWQFTEEGAGPLVLAPRGTASPVGYERYAALLRLATDAEAPAQVPVGEDVQVTGMFDHPAAAACRYDEAFDGVAESSPYCRGLFLVTSIR